MPVKVRKVIKSGSSRASRPAPVEPEDATLPGPPVAPRPAQPASTITGREWRVDPLVGGLSLAAALLVGVVISSLLIARARPTSASTPAPTSRGIVTSPARSVPLPTTPTARPTPRPAAPASAPALAAAPAVKPAPKPTAKPAPKPVVRRAATTATRRVSASGGKKYRKSRGKSGSASKHGRYARKYRLSSSDLRRIRGYFHARRRGGDDD